MFSHESANDVQSDLMSSLSSTLQEDVLMISLLIKSFLFTAMIDFSFA